MNRRSNEGWASVWHKQSDGGIEERRRLCYYIFGIGESTCTTPAAKEKYVAFKGDEVEYLPALLDDDGERRNRKWLDTG